MGTITSIQTKWEALKKRFAECNTQEHTYHQIIQLGKEASGIPQEFKQDEYLVQGCQSRVYLRSYTAENRMIFEADSDGLIAKGLAALLTLVYSDETAETILTVAPTYLDELGIKNALTPSRANGLLSIHLRMKQEALKQMVLDQKKR